MKSDPEKLFFLTTPAPRLDSFSPENPPAGENCPLWSCLSFAFPTPPLFAPLAPPLLSSRVSLQFHLMAGVVYLNRSPTVNLDPPPFAILWWSNTALLARPTCRLRPVCRGRAPSRVRRAASERWVPPPLLYFRMLSEITSDEGSPSCTLLIGTLTYFSPGEM